MSDSIDLIDRFDRTIDLIWLIYLNDYFDLIDLIDLIYLNYLNDSIDLITNSKRQKYRSIHGRIKIQHRSNGNHSKEHLSNVNVVTREFGKEILIYFCNHVRGAPIHFVFFLAFIIILWNIKIYPKDFSLQIPSNMVLEVSYTVLHHSHSFHRDLHRQNIRLRSHKSHLFPFHSVLSNRVLAGFDNRKFILKTLNLLLFFF